MISKMNSNVVLVILAMVTIGSWVQCQDSPSGTTSNLRMAKLVERHSESIRQFLCRKEQPITPEQWEKVKSECINTRLDELMPDNAIDVWQECHQTVTDLCDDQQWQKGKDCARDMINEEDIGDMKVWYRSRVRQMTNNFQVIRNCYQKQLSQ